MYSGVRSVGLLWRAPTSSPPCVVTCLQPLPQQAEDMLDPKTFWGLMRLFEIVLLVNVVLLVSGTFSSLPPLEIGTPLKCLRCSLSPPSAHPYPAHLVWCRRSVWLRCPAPSLARPVPPCGICQPCQTLPDSARLPPSFSLFPSLVSMRVATLFCRAQGHGRRKVAKVHRSGTE